MRSGRRARGHRFVVNPRSGGGRRRIFEQIATVLRRHAIRVAAFETTPMHGAHVLETSAPSYTLEVEGDAEAHLDGETTEETERFEFTVRPRALRLKGLALREPPAEHQR